MTVTFVGEVLDRARHGDDVAVVLAPKGRELTQPPDPGRSGVESVPVFFR